MERKLMLIFFGSLFLISLFIWYTYPKEINKTLNGLLFQLGSKNVGSEELLWIEIKGTIQNTIFGRKKFSGILTIDGEDIPPKEARDEEVEFDLGSGYNNGSSITYIYDDKIHMYGTIYIMDDFHSLAIAINEQSEWGGSSWNSGDGMMITAPATNREEALKITNDWLKHPQIKTLE